MKSLVLFSYQQPLEGRSFRWGVLEATRDTRRQPLALATLWGPYRKGDPEFKRTQNLETVNTSDGVKMFYRERQRFRVRIPLVGSLVARFLPSH